jgi:hypothetical protein
LVSFTSPWQLPLVIWFRFRFVKSKDELLKDLRRRCVEHLLYHPEMQHNNPLEMLQMFCLIFKRKQLQDDTPIAITLMEANSVIHWGKQCHSFHLPTSWWCKSPFPPNPVAACQFSNFYFVQSPLSLASLLEIS